MFWLLRFKQVNQVPRVITAEQVEIELCTCRELKCINSFHERRMCYPIEASPYEWGSRPERRGESNRARCASVHQYVPLSV